jgi:hypothetical protein
MRRVAALVILLLFAGCTTVATPGKDKAGVEKFSKVEVTLSDFSKTVVAYYERQGIGVPNDFNEQQFFGILEKNYPDRSKVESIKGSFQVKARSVDGGYSVMLCDRQTGGKLMEDFSCHLTRVELRLWDKDGNYPCTFEDNWKPLCE